MCFGAPTFAQVQVEVITKTIEKSFDYYRSDAVLIRGEKATIKVNTWANDEVKVKLKLISKAVDKATATRELEYQKYLLEKKRDVINLSNYYEVSTRGDLKSVLIAEYEVWVPVFSKLTIINSYGNIRMADKQGEHLITNRFGNIILNNVGGAGTFESYFGDFTAENFTGQNELNFNKTKTVINGLSGDLTMESQLGDITIDNPGLILRLEIKASKSDINIESIDGWEDFNINLQSEFGEVIISDELPGSPFKRGTVSQWKYTEGNRSRIKAETNFGVISLSIK
ncbi:MAG: DUF4097 family beta strand repeat-containing protein [Cyclobacteriaceae bacterium]